MQATVASYDGDTRSGTVVLDDGVVLAFETTALDGNHIRHLRSGQRLIVETAADAAGPRIVGLRIH